MPVDATVNGAAPAMQLRIAAIGLSIRSDWRNPAAATHRAVARALLARGHHFTFFEARLNEAITGQYREAGSRSLKAFEDEYADLHVRSYDPPPRRELGVWLGQIASAHDVIILLVPDSPDLLDVFERLQAPHVVRLIERQHDRRTVLQDLATGSVVTPYHPLEPGDDSHEVDLAAARAEAIEQSWVAAGIRM